MEHQATPHRRSTRGGPITAPLEEPAPRRAQFGRGRVVYLPQMRATREPVRTYKEIGEYRGQLHIRLPDGWERVLEQVRWAAGGSMAVEVGAVYGVTHELLRKGRQRLLHLVNYTGKPSGLTTVSVDPKRFDLRRAEVISMEPGVSGRRKLDTIQGRRSFLVPSIDHYAVVRLS